MDSVNQKPKVKIVLLGTPAEEGGGGKILMINNGCFKDLDFCMMVHPADIDELKPPCLAIEQVKVTMVIPRMLPHPLGKESMHWMQQS